MDAPSFKPSAISRWLPCSPLGSGAFGHVSLALNLDDGSFFAIKSSHSSSPAELLALQNELRILHALNSPFVLNLLGANFSVNSVSPPPASSKLFLEYMDGGSLFDAIKRTGGKFLQERRVRLYTRAILQGLSYLHQNGIAHSDIKCHNILTGSSGVKIADFGAARRLDEPAQLDGNLRGTPLWMAPEVAQGAEAMPASDIWSLGCTVVEMMQGRPPWGEVGSVAAALFKVGCSKESPSLPERISGEAKDFLSKCLQRDASARWTAGELLEHPFACVVDVGDDAICRYGDQPSPRSTLDMVIASDSESESEFESVKGVTDQSEANAGRCGRCGLERQKKVVASDWIVIKSREGWCELGGQAPFMAAREELAEMKKGSEVSFAAADFLIKKRRTRRAAYHVVG